MQNTTFAVYEPLESLCCLLLIPKNHFQGVRKGNFSIEEVNYSKSQQIFHDLPEFWLKRLLIQTWILFQISWISYQDRINDLKSKTVRSLLKLLLIDRNDVTSTGRFVWVQYSKFQYVENTISEPLDFKIFWGRTSKTPQQTHTSGVSLQRSPPPPIEIVLRL